MFERLARRMYRRRKLVVALWVLLILVAGGAAGQASSRLGAPDYSFHGSQASRVAAVLDHTFRQNGEKTTLVVLSSRRSTIDSPAFRRAAATVIRRVRSDHSLGLDGVVNPLVSRDPQSIARDRRALIITLSTRLSEAAFERVVPRLRADTRIPGFTTRLTGYSVLEYEQNQATNVALEKALRYTLPVMLLVLLIVFGSVVAAALPFMIAIAGIVLCVGLIWLLSFFMSMTAYVLDIASFIGLGISIDYSLFIVNRFREELARGAGVEDAVATAMRTAGRAVFFSGLAVAVGLFALLLTGLPFMQQIGIAGMAIPLATLLATLTLLPAVLGLLGPRVDRWRVLPRRRSQRASGGAWRSIARTTMRRPWVSGGIALLILLALAAPATRLTFAMGTLRQNQGTTPGVTALDYVKAHFATTPDPYVIVFQRDRGTLLNAHDLAAMRTLEQTAARDREVTRAFGLPDAAPTVSAARAAGPALRRFLSPDHRTGIIYLVPRDDPTSNANREGLRRLRADAGRLASTSLRGVTVMVGGSSAPYVDFDDAITQHLPLIVVVVLGLTYLFLFAAFRTVFLPFKAVLLNVLSVGASFGLLQLVFLEGYGVSLIGAEKTDGIPTWVLLFLFAFLFGLSMDYEVLLMSRIRETWLRTGNNEEAVAGGLEMTGRLISSAAVIMAIAFSGFILASSIWMKEMGLGLTVSILVDATVIRIILVPAIMQIAGRWNWWTPRFLHRWASEPGTIEEPADVATEFAGSIR